LLALAFFCLLTEMHERYSYPVIALLPIWAVTGAWKERAYLFVSVLMLLNLTVAQSVGQIGGDIGGLNLLLGGLLFVVLLWPAAGASIRANDGETPPPHRSEQPADAPPPSAVVSWFVRLTLVAALCALVVSALLGWQSRCAASESAMSARPPGVIYLGDLEPRVKRQGHGELRVDRAVQGGPLRLGDRYYLRGLGTHAPSMLEYELPEGFTRLRAVAGIDRHGKGRATLQVHLDGRRVLELGPLTAEDEPIEIDLPLGGAKRLRLSAKTAGSKKGDHVDWALARLEK